MLADDATVAALGAWPPPRELIAAAIGRLAAAGASVIVVNLLLAEPQAAIMPATRQLLDATAAALPPDAAPLRARVEPRSGPADRTRRWPRRWPPPAG